jgi:NAD(P)-dependent dehydrogenase (short-subunit alcohol dehydrogenase family)
VRAAAVHPGIIETELIRHLSSIWLHERVDQINQQLAAAGKPPLQQKSIPQGAATSVWAAVVATADEVGGRYCENCHVGQAVPKEVPAAAVVDGVRAYAVDAETAEALWKKSEELVGESF